MRIAKKSNIFSILLCFKLKVNELTLITNIFEQQKLFVNDFWDVGGDFIIFEIGDSD